MLLASLANGCVRLLCDCRLARSIHKRKFRQGLGMVGSPDATTNGRGKSMTPIHKGTQKEKNDETNNSDRSLRRWLSCSSGLMAPPLARHPSGNAGQHYG